MTQRILIVIALLAATTTAAGEPETSTPTIAQFQSVRGQAGVAIAPDGKHVVYLDDVTGTDQIWKVAIEGGWPEQISSFGDRVRSVSWSTQRTDDLIASVDRGGNERYQLYALRPDGSQRIRLTHDDGAQHALGAWSPIEAVVAYRANSRKRSVFDVYLLDLETGRATMAYASEARTKIEGFAPDGRRLLLLDSIGPDETRLEILDLDSGDTTPLSPTEEPARYLYNHWSSDGSFVWTLTDHDRDLLGLARLEVATGGLEYVRDDRWPAEEMAISADGRRLALVLNVDGVSELHLHDLERDLALPAPALPTGVVAGLDFTPDGWRLAIVLTTWARPHEVYVYDLESRVLHRTTQAFLAGLDESTFVEPRLVSYSSFDGLPVSGILYDPRLPGDEPRPCLVYAHGGPTSQMRPRFSSLLQYFASRGYVVFAPNVRGSSGYGRRFMNLDNGARREDAVRDLEQGVRWLIGEGVVDSSRVAVYGTSYGGYMVLAAVTLYPDMWVAGADRVGISNFVTFLENTGAYRRSHREHEYGSLAEDRELLERLSPLRRADAITAPLLVIHGANDPRVPIGEAEQLVEALRARGHPVEYLRYEDEGHGLSRLEHRIEMYTELAQFLERYLGEPVASNDVGEGGAP
jgi:dipeptidyl aminopeptidase/acylaminoacyl peptidase